MRNICIICLHNFSFPAFPPCLNLFHVCVSRFPGLCGAGPKICCSGALTAADANLATESRTLDEHADSHHEAIEEDADEDSEPEEEFPETM